MKEIYELYKDEAYRLVITTAEAGGMGLSYELDNAARKKVLGKTGVDPEKIMFVHQNHSRDVILADEHSFEPLSFADGIITVCKTDSIAVTVADCMPVFLYDGKNDVRALLHSGWKGTGIAANALERMQSSFGTKPSDVTAVLGPAIGSCCYNVDRQRAESFAAEWGDDAVVFRNGVPYLSLETANRNILSRAGVRNIVSSGICTSCSSIFGSFRREGPADYTQMVVMSYSNTKYDCK